jgi:hypothetical protein
MEDIYSRQAWIMLAEKFNEVISLKVEDGNNIVVIDRNPIDSFFYTSTNYTLGNILFQEAMRLFMLHQDLFGNRIDKIRYSHVIWLHPPIEKNIEMILNRLNTEEARTMLNEDDTQYLEILRKNFEITYEQLGIKPIIETDFEKRTNLVYKEIIRLWEERKRSVIP